MSGWISDDPDLQTRGSGGGDVQAEAQVLPLSLITDVKLFLFNSLF